MWWSNVIVFFINNPGEIPHCFLPMKITVRKQWVLYNHWKNGFTSNLTTTILCLELWYIKLCYLYITYFIDTQSKTNNIPFSSELNVTNLFILFFCLHNVYLSKTTAKLQRPNSLPYIHFFSILLPAHSTHNELIPNSLSSSWDFFFGEYCTRWSISEEKWPNSSICRNCSLFLFFYSGVLT